MTGRKQVIYFDQSATSYPKPEVVYQAQDNCLRQAANPGRGGHYLAMEAARTVFAARVSIAEFLGIHQPERLVFTPGCTAAINMALKGWRFSPGDLVVTSDREHNAVVRPLMQLRQSHGIEVQSLPQATLAAELEALIGRHRPAMVVIAEASNVTGEVADIPAIARICRRQNIPLMVDAAQSAGVVPQRVSELGISLWCASGHKGLLGPPGVGLLYVAPEVDLNCLVSGGTGSHSQDPRMPERYPDHLEAGTMNTPAIAGLAAAVNWIKQVGLESIDRQKTLLAEQLRAWCRQRPQVKLYGTLSVPDTGVVAFSVDGIGPDRVADLLNERYGIAVRSGLHCAPQAHAALGTQAGGLIRASFGYFNTADEVEELCRALGELLE